MSDINKHGLGRHIPESVKREARRRDGFGCVVCGNAIFQYEHFDPEFSEARSHDVNGITILCGRCHDKKTREILSLETIKMSVGNPNCKQSGFSFEAFDVGSRHPTISLGTIQFLDVNIILRVLGEELFSIKPPEIIGSPFRISAKLTDIDGKVIFEIADNEWKAPTANWDVEISGPRITIRKAAGEIALVIRSEPPDRLIVERIHMRHKGTLISGQEGSDIKVKSFNGCEMMTQLGTVVGCQIGIDIGIFDLKIGVGGNITMLKSTTIGSHSRIFGSTSPMNTIPKISRNSLCWCGSQLKFKKCHGRFLQT